jgi:CubicO group peptidase (beta-lactamase class C family)
METLFASSNHNMNKTLLRCIAVVVSLSNSLHAQLYFPPNGNGTWETIDPSQLQWCDSTIANLYDYLETNQSKAFILLKDGKIVLEQYFNGHDASTSWYWASAGKTLTAMLVGIAESEGLLELTDPTSNYLGQGWTSCTPEQESAITIWHQLTMTSGLNDGVEDHYCTLDTCLQYLADAGTRWAYHNGPYTLLDSVMEVASGQSLNLFNATRLLQPTGMSGLFVPIDYNNVFFSNARTMARYGLLLNAEGTWNGTPILNNPDYFYAMTHSSQSINQGYGYLTWLNGTSNFMLPESQFVFPGMFAPDAPDDMYAAIGRDGQFICVVPSQNIVWIRMGENPDQLDVPILMANDVFQLINALPCSSNAVEALSSSPIRFALQQGGTALSWSASQPLQRLALYSITGELLEDVYPSTPSLSLDALSGGLYVCRWTLADGQSGVTRIIKP